MCSSDLIGTGWLTPAAAYGVIFGMEAAGLLVAAALVLRVSSRRFRETRMAPLSRTDLTRAMGVTAT